MVGVELGVDFLVDIDEGRRNGFTIRDREGETVGGAGGMIGVLTEDDDGNLI